ncbi:hypothetical protein OPV22_022685 [Ensete ventricosum]|uniref:BAG domain-containing protein n=1 Tax=Ensete ventricosum TaxID=4639 RepID=A0AAV8QQE5_ENSVE|nr:hypothetical protein OPV22_022685 [Ensete ventricosum]
MDSYPPNRDHIPCPYHHYPSWEAVSPQTRLETARPFSSFGPWTSNGSVAHPSPTEANGCCSHVYPPGYYYFGPPCPYTPPPSQAYYHAPYPPYYGSYPSFVIPPPHYSADRNPHDYDHPRAYYCGCPNQTCNKGGNNSVKIEEQKAEKDQDNESSSLIRQPNYPYPVVCIPPNYWKNKTTNKSSEASPALWNGWIPMDINGPNGVKQDEAGKKSLQSDERRNQFPWPIIWMPGDQKSEDKDLKEINSNPAVEETPSSKIKLIPLKLLGDEHISPVDEEDRRKTIGHPEAVTERECRTKIIPVKHIVEDHQKRPNVDEKRKDKEEEEEEESHSRPEKQEENGAKKSISKQLSPTKTSKLPPVCLRVEPLPRKKTTNGTSRSPTPPGLKDGEKAHKEKTEREQPVLKDTKEEISKREVRVVEAADKLSNEAENPKTKSQEMMTTSVNGESAKIGDNQQPDKGTGLEAMKVKTVEALKNGKEVNKEEQGPTDKAPRELDEGKRCMENSESIINEQRKERKILSQSDAATVIQSAYRGFEVRRWQPLEKLRKIHQIHQQTEAVMKQIQMFEASSKEQDLKHKAAISETIMNLLLQLDTIQGLHPSVRDMRKYVVRELMRLQDKLDSLGDHEKMEVEQQLDSDGGAISSADSSVTSTLEPERMSSQSEKTIMYGKEATIKWPTDDDAVVTESPESLDSASGTDDLKSLNVGMGSTTEEHQDIPPLEEQLSSALREAVVSHVTGEEQSCVWEGVTEPGLEGGTETSQVESPSTTSVDEVLKLETNKHVECQGINSLSLLEHVRDELSDPEAGNDQKGDVEWEKSSGQDIKVAAEEADQAINPEQVKLVEATAGVKEGDFDVKGTVLPEVDTMREDLQVPDRQSCDLVVTEVPCSEQAILGIIDNGNDVQCTAGNPEKRAEDATYNQCHSPGKENGVNPMLLLPDDTNIIKDECFSSVETFEPNMDAMDGAVIPEISSKMKDGLVSAEKMPTCVTADTYEKGHSLVEAVDINKDEPFEANVNDAAHGNLSKEERTLVEENEKLREMLETLLNAGKAQLGVIADLNGRVRDLERKLTQKRRCKVKSSKPRTSPRKVAL